MDSDTLDPLTIASRSCDSCGASYNYEKIEFGGRELLLPHDRLCTSCRAAAETAEAQRQRAATLATREATARALLEVDLLETDTDFPTFNRPLWAAVRSWRPSKNEFWLGLIGPAGRCKTRCLTLAARLAILRGNRVTWTTTGRIEDAARDRNHRDREIYGPARQHLAECLHAGWLFIDDIGKNEWSRAFESQFFAILNHRKNTRLPLLYSSNAHPEQLGEFMSPLNRAPIIGRLIDRATIIEMRS